MCAGEDGELIRLEREKRQGQPRNAPRKGWVRCSRSQRVDQVALLIEERADAAVASWCTIVCLGYGGARRVGGQSTDLLHDAGLALGKGNVAARLVADELDLNLATLASALFVIVVVVVGRRRALALDAARLGGRAAIANRVGVVEVAGRALLVLFGDVGHGWEQETILRRRKSGRCITQLCLKRQQVVEMLL